MKVRITLTVDVDQDAWYETYGDDRDEIRENVKSYVLNHIQCSAAAEEEAITAVTAR